MTKIAISDRWRQDYPGAVVGFLAMEGVANPEWHPELDDRKTALEKEIRDRFAGLDKGAIKALPRIQAYNHYYKRFEKSYHVQAQLESVAFKGKPIPRVAALVEAMFMAELRDMLLTAGHDGAALVGEVRVDVASGSEPYTLLNGKGQVLKAGDMFMADAAGVISSVLYGPDQRTRITPVTREALFAVYAPSGVGEEAVREHLEGIRDNALVIAPGAKVASLEVYAAP